MLSLATPPLNASSLIVSGAILFVGSATATILAYHPLKSLVLRQERMFDEVLRGKLLMDVPPRLATILTGAGMLFMALVLHMMVGGLLATVLGLGIGATLPYLLLSSLKRRRLERLESQLVPGIQTLASGVRAGLNLVQALQMVARDGPMQLKQEFAHLVREYDFGLSLEEAMDNAAERIGSADFRLLFAALQTHRERGGDLGETLDRIAESVREIQRLENRVRTLTAQGRATARWLGAMPVVVLAILFFLVDPEGVKSLFVTDLGKFLIFGIIVLNIAGFLWIKKIVSLDV
jgi:tight adherence protein B